MNNTADSTNMDLRYFDDTFALSRLPYFEQRGSSLLMIDDTIGPIVDVHTHLALSYGPFAAIDLWRERRRTEHYLPVERKLDMEVYANKNFSPSDLKAMKRDLMLGNLTKGGLRTTHTAPNLLREMKELRIASSILLPIDFPILSGNADRYLQVAAKTDRLVSLASVHPFARDVARKLVQQKQRGARGIKVHPAVQAFPADHPRAMQLYRMCADLELPVLWHCGPVDIEPRLGRYFSQLKHYWRAVKENPSTIFILGHSGALQMEMGLELAVNYPNVYMETSSQSLGHLRRIFAEAPPERIMFGSDWPFYHQSLPLAKALLASEDQPQLRPRLFWENAAELFGLEIEAISS